MIDPKANRLREIKEAAYERQRNPIPKVKKPIARQSAKKKAQFKERQARVSAGEDPLENWFLERRKEMTGFCECGCAERSSRDDDQMYKSSAAHILPKRLFKSIAFHPLNWIELASFGGCHDNFDNLSPDLWPNMECWPTVVAHFKAFYPAIAEREHKNIPEVLLKTLNASE